MIQQGILNPAVNDLLSRIRHTNTLVIADWAFPYYHGIEVVDLSLIKGVPLITDLLEVLKDNFKVGQIWQAEEFLSTNPAEVVSNYDAKFDGFK
ncbi:MAG: D-ribose pyranase, partial [Granulosicoccus sp.]